jgi:tetratricopeptide (TPR) repeat protein
MLQSAGKTVKGASRGQGSAPSPGRNQARTFLEHDARRGEGEPRTPSERADDSLWGAARIIETRPWPGLKERTHERVPLEWAMTQNNLGTALQSLGERESGTARLDEAVTAYREALKERTRERMPLQWAMTQNNLGAALKRLGARESGTARLNEAVAAFREALKEFTAERAPYYRDVTQENLDAALKRLDERKQQKRKEPRDGG